MNDNVIYALIHSPLVGPLTWQLVHREMKERGLEAVTPALTDHPDSPLPYWQQHAASFARNIARAPQNRDLVLVAHSGAGPLLPVLRQSAARPVRAYVFVDAGIPPDSGLSRIDLMRLQDQPWADQFHQALLQGERYPTWSEADLQQVIPDGDLRRKLVAEINPRSLAFFTEPIPVFAGWPDAPCAYIKLSPPYDWDLSRAKQANWLVREFNAGHFHMLVDPAAVTDLILDAMHELGHQQHIDC